MTLCYTAKLSYALLLVLCLTALEAQAQSGDLVIEDETIETGTYEASGTLTARDATIESGSNVTFRAAESVQLKEGFQTLIR